MPYERLSPQDATLFCAEAPAAPLQVGALCLFEAGPLVDETGCLRIHELRRHIECRLLSAPRFRQKLVPIPFGQGRPIWVDDPSFDIAHHVLAAALPRPGSSVELRAFMTALLEVPLDRHRPLWEVHFVEGVEGDRIAVVVKVNHVMADGMAVLEFALSVLDSDPVVHAETPLPWTAGKAPAPGRLLVEGVADRMQRQIELGRKAICALSHPARILSRARTLANALTSTAVPAPRTAITRPVGPHRDFAWVPLPLSDLQRIARVQSVTLNDVVLAVVAGALGRYLGDETRADVRPRVLVPVSIHGGPGELENQFSMMVADLPPNTLDPLGRLRATHAEMVARKTSGQSMIGPVVFAVGELVPPWLLRLVAAAVLKRQPFVNLAVTNLPGTNDPVYLLGSRMLELFPFVTVTGNIALIIGVLSYNGTLGVGLTADADVIRDLDRITEEILRSVSELVASNSATSAARTRKRTHGGRVTRVTEQSAAGRGHVRSH